MEIRVTENVLINGEHVEAGTITNVSKEDGVLLKSINRAIDPDDSYTPPAKDEYLSLVEDMSDKEIAAMAKDLKVDIKDLHRVEANLILSEALKASEAGK